MDFEAIRQKIADMNELTIAIIVVAAAVFSMLLFILIRIVRKNRVIKRKLEISDRVDQIMDSPDFDGKYTQVLELVRKFVRGDGYFLYLYEKGQNRYKLKRVLFENKELNQNQGGIDVSYGRIMTYAKESYAPPLMFLGALIPKETSFLMEGRFPVLVVPIKEDKGFISVSTKQRRYKRSREYIDYMAVKLENLFQQFIMNKSEAPAPFEKETSYKDERTEKDILDFSLFVMGAKAGFFIKIEIDYAELTAVSGLDPKTEDAMRNDVHFLIRIEEFVRDYHHTVAASPSPALERLPPCLAAAGFKAFIAEKTEKGTLFFCYDETPDPAYLKDFRVKTVELLALKMAEKSKTARKKNSVEYYVKKLKALAKRIDAEEPYSVGFSELMSNYASAIAGEMKIHAEERKNIILAAYLSNIGTTVIPAAIFSKKGVYTQEEYEATKIHSEAGALLVALTIGNEPVEQFIRYHHERVDGLGYPEGLKGADIPLGARILAVVQTFSSKIRGRDYRESLSFDKIICMIEEEAGKSLDADVVSALVRWFKRKQENPMYDKNALGPCWEMRCASEEICSKCPVYKRTDKYCWRFDQNNCLAHGNTCETCLVYTEFINRNIILQMDKRRKKD